MLETAMKTCQYCQSVLRGRIDKKFCNDYCRNNFNNREKKRDSHHPIVRKINAALLKNRRILASVLPAAAGQAIRIHREKLQRQGFEFGYYTHIYTTQSGKNYRCTYEYGYLPLDPNWFLVVRRKEE